MLHAFVNAAILIAGSGAAILRVTRPPRVSIRPDGAIIPCPVNLPCTTDAGTLAVEVVVIVFVTFAVWLASREVAAEISRSSGKRR